MAFSSSSWISNLFFSILYQYSFLLFLYKTFKACARRLTGTSEVYRITKEAIGTQDADIDASIIFRMDNCLFHSKKLDYQRKKLEQRQYEDQDADMQEPFEQICEMKLLSPEYCNKFRVLLTRIHHTFRLMHEINQRANTRYDSTNIFHENSLKLLWRSLHCSSEPYERYGEHWTKIGFQGKDPSTDFRGMGCLALDDLLYLAQTYPIITKRILAASHQNISWFSFGIVGIHMTTYCLRLVRVRLLNLTFFTFGSTKQTYSEVYCFLFDQFEKFWTSQKTLPSAMDFNTHFRNFQVKMERYILQQQYHVLTSFPVLDEYRLGTAKKIQ